MPLANFGLTLDGDPSNSLGSVYRGAQPDAEAWGTLHALGVRNAIKLSDEAEYPAARESAEAGPGIVVCSMPVSQWKPDVAAVLGIAAVLLDLRKQAWGSVVFVHCLHGRDRTGLIVGAYKLRYLGWTRQQVEEERHAYGVAGIIALADREISEALDEIAKMGPA